MIGNVISVEMSYSEESKFTIRNGMNDIIVSECDFKPFDYRMFLDYGITIMNSSGEYKNGYILAKELANRMEELDMPTRWDAYDALCNGITLPVIKDRVNNNFNKDSIKDVIFNNPATIVKWKDGTKTVVKCQDGDTYNPELGLAMCLSKKALGNRGNYNDVFNKWLPKED